MLGVFLVLQTHPLVPGRLASAHRLLWAPCSQLPRCRGDGRVGVEVTVLAPVLSLPARLWFGFLLHGKPQLLA